MKAILRATAVLSSASAVSIVLGLVSAKVNAVLLGPDGVGYMGLLQGLVSLAMLVAGMGVSTGLIRAGAQALARADERQVAALRGGAWLLSGALGGGALLLMIVLRGPLSRALLGSAAHGGAVVLMGVALLFNLAAAVQTGVLNAYQRLGDLARVSMLTSVGTVAVTLLLVWTWRTRGIAPAVLAGFVVSWAVSFCFMRARTLAPHVSVARPEVLAAASTLLRFGGPYTASMLVGAGVQLLVPVLILHALGRNEVGYYRAASAIALTYLGFLLSAMAQDYYPRVAAASEQAATLDRLINEQLRLVLLLAGPIILGMLALVPYLVPLVYSRQFVPAVALLEWQLLGDLFKFASWTMSFVILARAGSTTFFVTELAGGALLLGTSGLGLHWFGLAGVGGSFALTSAIYCLLCWALLRRAIGLRWTMQNKLLFGGFAVAMLVTQALPYAGLGNFRTPLALALAVLSGAGSAYLIWGEVGGLQGLWTRRRPAD